MTRVETVDLATTTAAYYAPATMAPANSQVIHVAGQAGMTKDGTVPTDYESQIHLALLNLRKILILSGASVKDILKLTLYIVNYDPESRVHTRHLQRFLAGHRPAITLVPVAQLAAPAWLFEVDAVAVRPAPALPRSLTWIANRGQLDVVIVGAGLAGLSAASELQRAGLSYIILEARDRVGGKTWSQPIPGANSGYGMIDLGAAWMNDVNQSKVYALAKRFGAEILEQNTIGLCVLQDAEGVCSTFEYGELPKFDVATVRDVARIRDMVEADCHTLNSACPRNTEWDSVTFEAYLRSRGAGKEALATAAVWTRAMLGQDPRDVSALWFIAYCKAGGGLLQMRSDRKGGGQHLRIRQGMQMISKAIAETLPQEVVRLSSPVVSVTQEGSSGVEIVTADKKSLQARRAIITVPSPVLKTIDFSPKLPALKQLWAESANYGYYTKAMMIFRTPFWVEKGYCGLIQSFTGPASVIRDTSSLPDKKYILTCFMASDSGRAWAALPTDGRKAALIEQIGRLFDAETEAATHFVDMVTYEWVNDQYSGWGCPCIALAPGVMDATGEAVREPAGNLHFAGTETAVRWRGYMEGAIESGERAAAEVIDKLNTASSRL
ncbi:hypothetical protein BDW67DRAFT_186439 [Aspergillus spinulosporus]